MLLNVLKVYGMLKILYNTVNDHYFIQKHVNVDIFYTEFLMDSMLRKNRDVASVCGSQCY